VSPGIPCEEKKVGVGVLDFLVLQAFPGLILDPHPISRKVEIQLSGAPSSTFKRRPTHDV
jgi:hypothetical protein